MNEKDKNLIQKVSTFNPTAEEQPTSEKKNTNYVFMKQGKVTNAMAEISDTKNVRKKEPQTAAERDAAMLAPNFDLEILKRDCTFIIEGYYSPDSNIPAKWTIKTDKVMDFLSMKYTELSSPMDGIINTTVNAYANLVGKSNKKAAEELKAQLALLKRLVVKWHDKLNTKTVVGEGGIVGHWTCKRGEVRVRLEPEFLGIFAAEGMYRAAPMPTAIYRIDDRKYKHAYFIARKFAIHRQINGKKNKDDKKNKENKHNILSLETIIEACPRLPSIDDVKHDKHDRHYDARIIEPIRENLDQLQKEGVGEGFLCKAKGEPLTKEELAEKENDPEFLKTLMIQFDFYNYPEIKQLEEQKKGNENKEK